MKLCYIIYDFPGGRRPCPRYSYCTILHCMLQYNVISNYCILKYIIACISYHIELYASKCYYIMLHYTWAPGGRRPCPGPR